MLAEVGQKEVNTSAYPAKNDILFSKFPNLVDLATSEVN